MDRGGNGIHPSCMIVFVDNVLGKQVQRNYCIEVDVHNSNQTIIWTPIFE